MGTYELHEHAPEREGDVHDQPVFVAAEIEDDPIIADEIDGSAELPLYLGRPLPLRLPAGNAPRIPSASDGRSPASRNPIMSPNW
jgi:hypothetical protein